MRWLFPWGNFVRKSGDTITGNLNIEGLLNCNDTITITKDVIGVADPHIALKPATGAGLYDIIECQNTTGAFEGGIGSDISTNMFILPGLSGAVVMPLDILDPDPPWKVPLLANSLGVRRMLLFHSMVFG